ncbi:hypothetical protein K1W54_18435 [Micromonospora sp. CPCC 205371]|nr:hypothetical protein [Micromonospora sp. CPCC 205371]
MGILVDFRKVREDNQTVEYLFGYPEMDRRLVVQKDSQTGRPLDGETNGQYSHALMGILKRHHRDRAWPDRGTWAS